MTKSVPLFYFGNIAYWSELIKLEKLCFTPHFPIPKKTYANRTVILMANGLQTLTVPIVGGRGSKIPMDQIEISYLENWIAKHKMALQSAYAKSSYYEHYMPYFEPIWAAKPHTLMQLNLNIFKMLSKVLKLHVEIVEEENTNLSEVQFIPNIYSQTVVSYPQVFRYKFPFHPDLSILDLLFCLGPDAKSYLEKGHSK